MKLKNNAWLDAIALIFSVVVIGLSVKWLVSSGLLEFRPAEGTNVVWYLVRSTGIVAYLLLLASMVWGLFITSKFARNWSPGVVSLTMHSTVSYLAIVISVIHAGLLLFDDYLTYTLRELMVPFTGPYQPFWVGMGIIAFWLMVLVSVTFPIRKLMGYRRWLWLHYASYAAYGMVAGHAVFAGTDGTNTGFRLLSVGGIAVIIMLVGARSEERENRAKSVEMAAG